MNLIQELEVLIAAHPKVAVALVAVVIALVEALTGLQIGSVVEEPVQAAGL